VIFDKRASDIIDEKGNIILIADRVNDLYYLREVKPECNATIEKEQARDPFELWHQRMGHLNARNLANSIRNRCSNG